MTHGCVRRAVLEVASRRGLFESEFGARLVYDELPGKRACRIHFDRPEGGDVIVTSLHETYFTWFLDTFARFRPATDSQSVPLPRADLDF